MNAAISNPVTPLTRSTIKLVDLLLQERQAIADNNPDQLAGIVSAKEALLTDLVRQELSFRNAVTREGFSMDRGSIEAWMERHRLPLISWHSLRATLSVVKELNAINGNVVSRSQRTTRRVLEILSGQPEGGSTYQANGLHSSLKLKRALGNA